MGPDHRVGKGQGQRSQSNQELGCVPPHVPLLGDRVHPALGMAEATENIWARDDAGIGRQPNQGHTLGCGEAHSYVQLGQVPRWADGLGSIPEQGQAK